MASGPNWNPQRGTWQVQYWDEKWHRVTVAKKEPGWKVGDPPTDEPPAIAYAEFERLKKVEMIAKARAEKRVALNEIEEPEGGLVVPLPVVFRDALWTVIESFLVWSTGMGFQRIDELTEDVSRIWLKEQLEGMIEDERRPWWTQFATNSEE